MGDSPWQQGTLSDLQKSCTRGRRDEQIQGTKVEDAFCASINFRQSLSGKETVQHLGLSIGRSGFIPILACREKTNRSRAIAMPFPFTYLTKNWMYASKYLQTIVMISKVRIQPKRKRAKMFAKCYNFWRSDAVSCRRNLFRIFSG